MVKQKTKAASSKTTTILSSQNGEMNNWPSKPAAEHKQAVHMSKPSGLHSAAPYNDYKQQQQQRHTTEQQQQQQQRRGITQLSKDTLHSWKIEADELVRSKSLSKSKMEEKKDMLLKDLNDATVNAKKAKDKAQEAARVCQNTLKFQFEDAGSTTQKVLRYLDVSLSKLMQKQSEQERQLDDESSHMKSALAEKVQKIVSRK